MIESNVSMLKVEKIYS